MHITCSARSKLVGPAKGSSNAKHTDLNVHFVQKARTAGHLVHIKLNSKGNAAYILTKASTPYDVTSDLRRRTMGH